MATTLQFRRGDTSAISSQTGAVGELFVDTDKDTVVVMDGSTSGGFPLARESAIAGVTTQASAAFNQANTATNNASGASTLAQAAFDTANNKFNSSGGTISGGVTISGDLIVAGNTTSVSANNLIIDDPMIVLANNNTTTDLLDIGFIGHYGPEVSPGENRHTGIVRHALSNEYYVFYNYDKHIHSTNNIIDIADASFLKANVNAGVFKGDVVANTATFAGSQTAIATKFKNASETALINAIAISANTIVNIANGSVQLWTANSSSNTTLNVTWSSVANINSVLAVGESLSTAVMITNGATAYYPTAYQIDGLAVTPRWQANTVPTGGNANSVDVYAITIIKTGETPTYTVLASQTQYR
jgi:hypothetical protein